MGTEPVRLEIYQTAIPMRTFEHAAARRDVAEAVVVRMEFSDGRCGWGETLPRQYVTGETISSVAADIAGVIWPAIAGKAYAFARFCELPQRVEGGRCINAALCAIDLAFHHAGAADCGPGKRTPKLAGRIAARVSGVLGSADPGKTARRLRLMRLYGLRNFKLKLGFSDQIDEANLKLVHKAIGAGISAGKYSLRVDVNGAWQAGETPERAGHLQKLGVCAIEQPVYCPADEFADLARKCPLPLIADESLLTEQDAAELSDPAGRIIWSIRLSKNGGIARSVRMANIAAAKGGRVKYIVGCMVGESGLLSAAQRYLLRRIAPPMFVEGNYGRCLLAGDLTFPSPMFGYGGRLRCLGGSGLGVKILTGRLAKYGKKLATLR
ncbi:MAG: hypothetical protein HZA50_02620 [Planctomycetes bacterium]|nr:hypothetical protein [Planctomycetota bacterium]